MRHSTFHKTRCKQTLTKLTALSGEKTANAIAVHYGVWPTDVRRALNTGYVSPALAKAVVKPVKRVRFSADVSPELRDELRAEAERMGLTNGELIELIFDFWKATEHFWDDATG